MMAMGTTAIATLTGPSFIRSYQSSFTHCFKLDLGTHLHRRVTMGLPASEDKKTVWVWTKSKDVMTASIERGWDTFIFTPKTQPLCEEWKSMAKIRSLVLDNGKLYNEKNEQVALFAEVSCAEDLEAIKSLSFSLDTIVMDAVEWQIINAENMVAFFQNKQISFFATARSSQEAQLFLGSLEKGTDGVVLQTEEASQVLELKAYLASREKDKIPLQTATVKRAEAMGMGDRVCVDLCSLLVPGEGLLVGSFARGLFLVHSECLESNYVASRPFRINAGPVHAYVAMPGGKTSYLAELKSGAEVLIVDAYGRQRTAIVGRVKIESRPLILIEAVLQENAYRPQHLMQADDCNSITYSLLLQNAETVNLVRSAQGAEGEANLAIPVTNINPGDKVLISIQETAARHTGIAIREFISEK